MGCCGRSLVRQYSGAEAAFDTEPIKFRIAEDRKQFLGVTATFFADEVTELPPRGIADS